MRLKELESQAEKWCDFLLHIDSSYRLLLVRIRRNVERYHGPSKNLHNLKNQTVMVTLSTALTSTPLSECAAQSVNLILSKCHCTVHPHSKTLFSLQSLFTNITSCFCCFS